MAASILEYARAVQHVASNLVADMRPPAAGGPNRTRVALFLSIVEQLHAAVVLGQCGAITHSAVHVRSMLEALVSMRLLEREQTYSDQMRYEQLRGEKKVYESIIKDDAIPDLEKDAIRGRLTACKAKYDELHAAGLRPRRISEDFGTTGLAQFAGPYAVLCAFSHNDIAVLAARHQGEHTLTLHAPVDPALTATVFSIAIFAAVVAAEAMQHIALFKEGDFEKHFVTMNVIWKAVLDGNGVPSSSQLADGEEG